MGGTFWYLLRGLVGGGDSPTPPWHPVPLPHHVVQGVAVIRSVEGVNLPRTVSAVAGK